MSDEDRQSRTEEPTETKLREARGKGNLPVSREVAAFAALLGMLGCVTLLLPAAGRSAATLLAGVLDHAAMIPLGTGADASALLLRIGLGAGAIVGPLLAVLGGCGVLASALQAPLRFVPSRLAPDASRVSPRAGLRRLLGLRGAAEFGKSLAKTLGIGAVVGLVLRGDAPRIHDAMFADPAALPAQALTVATHLLAAAGLAAAILTVADVAWTRWRWRADLRMTRHEVKEEHRQAEGDPLVKARLRSIALDRARRRMMSNVPRATLVVTNPTHFAVALRYVRAEGGAPVVVAKGQDLLALRIREAARAHAIPIVENKPLARALYDQVEVESMIPAEFYRAVAEILNLLERRKRAPAGNPAVTVPASLGTTDAHSARRAALLRAALKPFADELRLVDCGELTAHIARGQFANLDDIVQSSLELFDVPRAFSFGWGAQVEFTWWRPPVLALDMEFSGGGITVFFVLRVAADDHQVEIRCLFCGAAGTDPEAGTRRLAAALRAGRQGSDKTAGAP